MTVRDLQQPRGWAFSLAVPILKPLMLASTKRTWEGGENLPATGGCIVVFNHISHADPLTAAHFVYDHGRIPRYLAKSGLFKVPRSPIRMVIVLELGMLRNTYVRSPLVPALICIKVAN